MQLDPNGTVKEAKKKIYETHDILEADSMSLSYAGIPMDDNQKLSAYKIKNGDTLVQSKEGLENATDIVVSYEPDAITFDDTVEARALMPCGHVISTETMTSFLKSLIEAKNYKILCPSNKSDGSACQCEWSYQYCQKVGVLTADEKKAFEEGFANNLMD